MSKNIAMQELTASGYEELYPKTVTRQVVGINDYDWQIGDIRNTARTDLGDKWLLCNGSVIDTSDEYSEVGDLLGKSAGKWILENTVATNKFFTSSVDIKSSPPNSSNIYNFSSIKLSLQSQPMAKRRAKAGLIGFHHPI